MSTAIVSRDPGGAEVLSAYIKKYPVKGALYYLKGPSRSIFIKKGLVNTDYKFDGRWNRAITRLVASMNWQDGISFRMIKEAKRKKIKTEIIMDGWYDYSTRFSFYGDNWIANLPRRLIVCDDIAEGIARRQKIDKYCAIKKIKNPYFNELKEAYSQMHNGNADSSQYLLFASSPIREAQKAKIKELRGTKTTEADLLEDVLEVCTKKNIEVKIRLHPSQSCSSANLKDKKGVILNKENSLIEDIRGAEFVVGFYSMALVVAALLGKNAICFSKSDIRDAFLWEKYGVLKYYGIRHSTNKKMLDKMLASLRDINR